MPGSWRNARDIKYNPRNFLNAALAGTGEARNGGGPIWAIFDSQAVEREGWVPEPPHVDIDAGLLLQRQTRSKSWRRTSRTSSSASRCRRTCWQRPWRATTASSTPASTSTSRSRRRKYKIETPPFYAAWSTPVMHDTRVGLRINGKSQVVDLQGEVIPGLYCGGESAGGFSQHGLARCVVQGRIAGINAAAEQP